MDKLTLFKLMEEIGLQCRLAQFAYQNMRTSLNALDSERVFFFLDAFLVHAAHVSRLLWPARAESRPRGDHLRAELQVPDDSPVRLRDFIPHYLNFDERLEDWIANLEQKNYIDMNIMPQGTIADFKQDRFHRSLDPDTYKFHFRGDACDLRPVAGGLQKIEAATRSWLKTHNPW